MQFIQTYLKSSLPINKVEIKVSILNIKLNFIFHLFYVLSLVAMCLCV